jgi:hypothetical protein
MVLGIRTANEMERENDLQERVVPNLGVAPIALILAAAVLCSCALTPHREDTQSASREDPVREVSVLVASEEGFSPDRIDALISDASDELEKQVGIRLKVADRQSIDWKERKPIPMLQHLYYATQGRDQDLVIGFGSKAPMDRVVGSLLGGWQAVTDDTYRRYIVMTSLDRHILLHEIGHAFIFSRVHSDSGLMQGVSLQLLPGMPVLASNRLAAADREEVLANKWRDFRQVPTIAARNREHTIAANAQDVKGAVAAQSRGGIAKRLAPPSLVSLPSPGIGSSCLKTSASNC